MIMSVLVSAPSWAFARDARQRTVLTVVQDALAFIRSFEGPVPGAQHSRECGNYLDHDLPAARAYAADYAKVLEGWSVDAMHYAS